MSTSSLITE